MEFARRNLRLETLAWELSFGGTFVWELSFGKFRLIFVACYFRLGSFVWELSLWKFRFGIFALEFALRNRRLETLDWELSLEGNFRLRTFA